MPENSRVRIEKAKVWMGFGVEERTAVSAARVYGEEKAKSERAARSESDYRNDYAD